MRIPPNGYAGTAQQTAATMQTLGRMGGVRRARTRNKKRRAAARPLRAKRRTSKRRPARLMKGSRAAKMYMARIRRKRR